MTQCSDNFSNDSFQEHEETKSLRHEHSLSCFFQCDEAPPSVSVQNDCYHSLARKNTLGRDAALDLRAYTLIAESPQTFNL